MKTYTDKGNCARAAKAALGKDAKNGVDFKVEGEPGKWHWTAIGDRPAASHTDHAPAAKKSKTKAAKKPKKVKGDKKPPIEEQPANVEVIKMMQRVGGATIEQICERKEWTPHTTRAVISRLRSAGVPMTQEKHGRKSVFHSPAPQE